MYIIALDLVLVALFATRILARSGMQPSARMAWLMVIIILPFVGSALYFLFGEIDLGHKANAQQKRISALIRQQAGRAMGAAEDLPGLVAPPLRNAAIYAASVNGFQPVGGNIAELMPEAAAARARMLEDIEAATHSVHIMYYIWLDDKTGSDMAAALIRAVGRGVTCRAMVDGLGSRAFVKSCLWQQMRAAGVQLAVALPINKPIRTILTSRLDLRNHRKITVIDGRIAYCGSQNCADPEFRIKAKYAPWVDIMLRLQGPVVAQSQLLFASDWLKEVKADLACFPLETTSHAPGFTAQVLGCGPTERAGASQHMFVTLIESSRHELLITTPYFVPDPTVIEALCSAAYRQVKVTLTVPQKNDSWIVAAASKSYYKQLLEAGVKIYEFRDGLLHAKALTIDGQAVFIGSSNMDIRSFDLNYENDMLLQDQTLTEAIRRRQMEYIAASDPVCLADIAATPLHRNIWQNVIAAIGPLL